MVRLLVSLCLCFLASLGHAAIPATQSGGTQYRTFSFSNPGVPLAWAASRDAACALLIQQTTTANGAAPGRFTDGGGFGCTVLDSGSLYFTRSVEQANNPITYSCPENSTLSGQACTCNSGFSQSGAQCVNATEAKCSDAKGGTDLYTGHSATPPVGQSYCPSSGNGSQCAAIVEGGFAGKKAGQPLVWTYEIKYTGGTCTPPSTTPAPTPTVCKGQPGTVNGVEVCIPFGKNDPVQTVKNTTSTNPVAPGAPAGSGGSTSSTQESTCTASKCTTTTTTTTTDGAGVSTTTTKTDDVPKDDFCKENPKSIACKEFNFGDLESQEVGNKNVQLGIVKEEGFGPTSGTCPAPKVATVLGVSLVMPYTLLCEFAEKIKPLLIGFAYLSAALTFFGFARK